MTTARTSNARSRRAGRARRGTGDQLRDEILDAAERLLVDRGSVDAVSIRAVAGAVGVTPPSIYLHFTDKEALFFAVCSRRFTRFGSALLAATEGVEGPVEQLYALGRGYVEYGLTHPEHYPVLFSGHVDPTRHVEDVASLPGYQALQLLISVVARGMEEGVLAPGDPAQVAIGLWSTTHGFVSLALTGNTDHLPGIDLRGSADAVLRQAIPGILSAP
ncbi:MAG: TetR family transcriptional regulator [Nitriliruptorales bacterium]|nr:TetR family transcriptional regulator [Nitriliruptorales bacterium]